MPVPKTGLAPMAFLPLTPFMTGFTTHFGMGRRFLGILGVVHSRPATSPRGRDLSGSAEPNLERSVREGPTGFPSLANEFSSHGT
jgi:hypothetical protein